MPGIFEALPGIDVPVGSISKGLAQMWAGEATSGKPAPDSDHAKATQVNFVLHLGLNTDAEDAVRQFDIAVKFSKKHPSRVVVLCPLKSDEGITEMRAKVYGECSIGKTKDDTRCCEFVMLSYPRAARSHMESQVSICLSTDLPLYYWAHRFSQAAKLGDYQYLLKTARRVLIDTATSPPDTETFKWPKPENVRDLAFARLLPVRQLIGQFLSKYPAATIAESLTGVELRHGAGLAAEGKALLHWAGKRLAACGAKDVKRTLTADPALGEKSLALSFVYSGAKTFSWQADLAASQSHFEADYGAGKLTVPATVSLMAPENALGEAMFF
jgi:glucose-6-phosphate dehydrogenase assembly protein OpcA